MRLTLLEPLFATQTFVPSNATPHGCVPTAIGADATPVAAFTFVTLLLLKLLTQMFVPSKASPSGPVPTAVVPATAPVRMLRRFTLFVPKLATQTLEPSNAISLGFAPTAKLPKVLFASYQCNVPSCPGFFPPPTTPIAPTVPMSDPTARAIAASNIVDEIQIRRFSFEL